MLNEKKKVVPKIRQEVKVKVDIVTSDDIKIYYTGKFQDFTASCIIKSFILPPLRDKFLQPLLNFFDSCSWEIHWYSRIICEPMNCSKVETITKKSNLQPYDPMLFSLPRTPKNILKKGRWILEFEKLKSCSRIPCYLVRIWAMGNFPIDCLFVVAKIK